MTLRLVALGAVVLAAASVLLGVWLGRRRRIADVVRAAREVVTALAELIGETSDRVVAADSSARGAALTARRIERRDAVLLVEVQTSEVEEQLGARMGVLTEALRPVDQVTVEDGIVVVVARDARPSTERVRERILAGWIASGGRGRLLVRDASAPTTDTETAT